jgi:hypothetical protein
MTKTEQDTINTIRKANEARIDAEAECEGLAIRRTNPWRKSRQHQKNERIEAPKFSLLNALNIG